MQEANHFKVQKCIKVHKFLIRNRYLTKYGSGQKLMYLVLDIICLLPEANWEKEVHKHIRRIVFGYF